MLIPELGVINSAIYEFNTELIHLILYLELYENLPVLVARCARISDRFSEIQKKLRVTNKTEVGIQRYSEIFDELLTPFQSVCQDLDGLAEEMVNTTDLPEDVLKMAAHIRKYLHDPIMSPVTGFSSSPPIYWA